MSTSTAEAPTLHQVITPEGVALPFQVARAGDRVAALLIDLALISAGTLLSGLFAFFGVVGQAAAPALSVALLISFFLRNFYFIFFEARWGGVTPGKRRLGLRVISADGGELTTEAIFARNLTRDLELFLPVTVLLVPGSIAPDAPGWAQLLASVWLFVFFFLPLFNSKRLRCGDMVAGTMVIEVPISVLMPDLAHSAPATAAGGGFDFTQAQLDIYGIRELQVLEDLLRRYDEGRLGIAVLEEVCTKVVRKIDWPDPQVPVVDFLRAFYRAQRGRLEQQMLFGKRRERKRPADPPAP